MQYLGDILCLEYDELVHKDIIDKPDTYNKLRQRGRITVHGVGGNGRKVLIEYESLPEKYKGMVQDVFGDPYQYASKQPILDALIWDDEAYSFYSKYVLPNGSCLPCKDTDLKGKSQINYVERYTWNATWLNMLGRMTADKSTLKKELGIKVMDFWRICGQLIHAKNICLPATRKHLQKKIDDYKAIRCDHGSHAAYEFLIEKHKFGNDHSKKVADKVAESFLKDLLSKNHDDVIVQMAYNQWAKETGRNILTTSQAVHYRRKQWQSELLLERKGIDAVNSALSKKIKGNRPSAPLLLINSDDNVLDTYFRNDKVGKDGKLRNNPWYRPVLYVVMDAFNDYPLGYAWGDSVTIELIKEAYRNAQRYVANLTGNSYGWQQLQTDRWSLDNKQQNELGSFYRSMSTSTPAALKNANSKYIERAFGITWHKLLKLMFKDNYSGHNLTAKTKTNRDHQKVSNFPDISEAPRMIEEFIWAYRSVKNQKTGKTRHEEWLEAFKASTKAKKKLWSDAERLQIFGKIHRPKNGSYNRITPEGVKAQINGHVVQYEVSQQDIYQQNNAAVQIYYDETDLSKVLVTDGKGYRRVLQEWDAVPRALADYQPNDKERIKKLQEEKKTLLPMIQGNIEERKAILERAQIDAESRLQAGVMVKQLNHDDTRLVQSSHLPTLTNSMELPDDETTDYMEMDEELINEQPRDETNGDNIWDAI